MLSDNVRGFLQMCAWGVIAIGVLLAALSGLGYLGVMPGPVTVGGGGPLTTVLSLLGRAAASVVQGGLLLALLSIDERLQNRGH
ncbi:hypothetical protein [Brevundimonas sp.]|uniref:hypothetical protein n=1 Tax=Brevundimonas sp. TaxID=1871086 RepID=UPI003AF509CB